MTSREYGRPDIGRKPGMPRVDKTNISFKQLNKKDDPEAFKTQEEVARDNRSFWEAARRLEATVAREKAAMAGGARVAPVGSEDDEVVDDDEPLPSEADNDNSGDYVPGGGKAKVSSKMKGKAKAKAKAETEAEAEVPMGMDDDDVSWKGEVVTNDEFEGEEDYDVAEGESVTSEDTELGEGDDAEEEDSEDEVPADALAVDDAGWKYRVPKSLPLTYYVHANAAGGLKAKTIRYDVDFNDRDSVNKANKTRRLEVNRSKARHGINAPLRRPSTKGREFTAANDQAITDFHTDWAANNDGLRIPALELTVLYNRRFPGEGRSKSSIISYIDRQEELKEMRYSYPAR